MYNWRENVNNYDEQPKSNRKKVLAEGLTKVGKTYLGGTFPNPFIIDTDHSLEGLGNKHIPSLSISRDDVLQKNIKAYEMVYDIIRALRDHEEPFMTKYPNIQTLMIDGVTSLAELFLYEAMLDSKIGKESRDPLYQKATFDEYGTLLARLETIFTIIDDLDINIYVTSGLKMDKDEVSGIVMGMPDVVGGFRQTIGHRFDAVLYMIAEKGAYYATCIPASYKFPCGIRNWKGPERIENPTFEKIFDKNNFGG